MRGTPRRSPGRPGPRSASTRTPGSRCSAPPGRQASGSWPSRTRIPMAGTASRPRTGAGRPRTDRPCFQAWRTSSWRSGLASRRARGGLCGAAMTSPSGTVRSPREAELAQGLTGYPLPAASAVRIVMEGDFVYTQACAAPEVSGAGTKFAPAIRGASHGPQQRLHPLADRDVRRRQDHPRRLHRRTAEAGRPRGGGPGRERPRRALLDRDGRHQGGAESRGAPARASWPTS